MERVLRLSSEPGDLAWEPFGGLFTVALAAGRTGRRCVSAKVRAGAYRAGVRRLEREWEEGAAGHGGRD
jgi:site-specific DNA-methyltransferase (adenine-specific)